MAPSVGTDEMTDHEKVRCYAYVTRPYEAGRAASRECPLDLFQHATASAAGRADSVATSLVQVDRTAVGRAIVAIFPVHA
jgi:hypothetical protein